MKRGRKNHLPINPARRPESKARRGYRRLPVLALLLAVGCAAPHAAAVAARLLDGKPGIIMADTAPAAPGVSAAELELGTVTAVESIGNGNGYVESGERGALTIELRNNGPTTLTGVTATLTSNTPGVTVIPPPSAYPDIAAGGGTATNRNALHFIVGSAVEAPTTASFTLTVNYSGGTSSRQTFNFTIGISRTLFVSTFLGSFQFASNDPGNKGVGTQIGRLARTDFGTNSSCDTNKPNPNVNAADATVEHRFDVYEFTNTTNRTICVTITLITSEADALRLQSAAYAPTFDPFHVSDNYLGDIAGNQAGVGTRTYSVNVPANTRFQVVVNEVDGGGGVGTAYSLKVDGLPTYPIPPPLVSLEFLTPSTQVQEDCAGFYVTVKRGGSPADFPVSVDYETSDGTASSRSDYTRAFGTVNFAAGQSLANIRLLVSEDSKVEGNETFTVTLSNPQGIEAKVGARGVTTVEILDDAPADGGEPAANAIDDTLTFVCQHYHDFLSRDPDDGGWAFWKTQIDACGTDAACIADRRVHVSAAFFLSIEFQETGFLVHRFYQEAYGRRIGGTVPLTFDEYLRDTQRIGRGIVVRVGNWEAQLEANKQAFALEFVRRPEFLAVYPRGLNAAQFVDALIANTGVTVSADVRDQLVAALASNNTDEGRATILRLVADNADFVAAERNRAFVLAQYFGYLRRNPNDPPDGDFVGFNFWLTKLNQFNGNFVQAEMVKAFISSDEYRQRFGR